MRPLMHGERIGIAEALLDRMSNGVKECKVCLGSHEDEIHDATSRVRRWFGNRLKNWLAAPEEQLDLKSERMEPAGDAA